ncbi:protein kinase [Archangium gephyra]|uniref:protein kinase domain-containing protein n=1 Tax=Archangium gephyra TaxID=48 RepID=UPI0035D504FA
MNVSAPRLPVPGTCPLCASPLAHGRCVRCGAAASPGGFRVLSLLSQSPHGRLYAAEAPDGSRVALKELVFAFVPDVRQLEAFEREARLLREVSHPRIPRFVAHFHEGEGVHTRLYLAQQFVEGTPLVRLLRERALKETEAFDIAHQVLEVLQYLHGLSPPIVHRDIKPANLVRREDGTLFLVDFGAARDLLGHRTASATLVGTFEYMPPEQLGGTVDVTCDLYALGATLIHLLGRQSPELLRGPDLELRFEGLVPGSGRLHRFLRKLVARDPAARFPSALDALLALESPAGDGRIRRPWKLQAALGAVLLLGLGVGVRGLLRPAAPPPEAPRSAPVVAAVPAPAPPPEPETGSEEPAPAKSSLMGRPIAALGSSTEPEPSPAVPTRWKPAPGPLKGFDLVARWRFDEFEGDPVIHDDTGHGHVQRDIHRVPGVWDGAIRCHNTNTDQGFSTDDKDVLKKLEEGSLSLWIRRDELAWTSWVFAIRIDGPTGQGLGPALFFGDDGLLHLNGAWPEDVVAREPFDKGVFHHVAATWGAKGTRLYVDGALAASDKRPGRLPQTGQFMLVCIDPTIRGDSPQLTVDDLSVYRGELTPQAIATLARAGRGRTRAQPLSEEHFSQMPERWTPAASNGTTRVSAVVVAERGEHVLHVSRGAAAGGAGPIVTWEPPWRLIPRGKQVWLEYDVRVDAHEPGPRSPEVPAQGLVLQLEVENEKREKASLWVGHSPHDVRSPARGVTLQRQVRPGEWLRRHRVELNGLLGQDGHPLARIVRLSVLGHGAGVTGALDNLSLVEE